LRPLGAPWKRAKRAPRSASSGPLATSLRGPDWPSVFASLLKQ